MHSSRRLVFLPKKYTYNIHTQSWNMIKNLSHGIYGVVSKIWQYWIYWHMPVSPLPKIQARRGVSVPYVLRPDIWRPMGNNLNKNTLIKLGSNTANARYPTKHDFWIHVLKHQTLQHLSLNIYSPYSAIWQDLNQIQDGQDGQDGF